jgi:hypothetical protein
MAAPPFDVGAVKAIFALALAAVAINPVGAPGTLMVVVVPVGLVLETAPEPDPPHAASARANSDVDAGSIDLCMATS